MNGRCKRRSWRDTNSSCNGERETGLVISSISFSVRLDAVSLSPLQEEFVSLHERLSHLPFTVMFHLVKLVFLPNTFQKLNNKAPPGVSCLFGTAHRNPWRFKKKNDGHTYTLRVDDISGPVDTVGVDQLISAQPGLVSQDKGILTSTRIWSATVFIDYVTGYFCVALIIDQSGESTLQAKHYYNHLAATRNEKFNHYHSDNGRFA